MAGGLRKVVEVDMGRYKSVELTVEEAEKLLSHLSKQLGYEPQDLEETYRVLRNFEAFYDMARRKYKDYIVPSKSLNDMIRGTVLVDRLKLIKEGDQRKIVITFDRRVKEEVVVEALEKLGYEVEVKRIELL
ncbi:MAG: hypothetical protein ACO2O2_04460 [Acidilobaceae archaeon]|jgi:hypothetical protein|nr:hypothetical protein [Desulfurococcaceae archaeon]MCC6060888.1 hypothetical protein [Desulfurococcaceae archaeon]MDT7865289.1 hypothetical protein [Desulfurococcales archaeon]